MRRLLILMAACALALPAFASNGRHWGGNHGLSFNIDDEDGSVTSCSQIHVTYDGRDVAMISEDLPVSGLRSLKVRSDRNGGIHVNGGAGAFSVTACKASALGDPHDLRVQLQGNEITADGADREGTVIYYIVNAPRNAALDMTTNNGPIGIDAVDGTVTAHAQNGPISVKDSSGTLDISTQNGPISYAGESGRVKLHATNGPISVKLAGSSFSGSLDVEVQNGPLSLKLPRGYRSGVVIESSGNGPVTCRAEDCRKIRRFNDEGESDWPRRIELGTGARAVTLSTSNGPISVRED